MWCPRAVVQNPPWAILLLKFTITFIGNSKDLTVPSQSRKWFHFYIIWNSNMYNSKIIMPQNIVRVRIEIKLHDNQTLVSHQVKTHSPWNYPTTQISCVRLFFYLYMLYLNMRTGKVWHHSMELQWINSHTCKIFQVGSWQTSTWQNLSSSVTIASI